MTNAPKMGNQLQRSSREKHPDMRVPYAENPTWAAFKEYEDITKTVSLDLTENDVTSIASKLVGVAGVLGAEAIELRNCILRFGCAYEELRVFVASLVDWMANSFPPGTPIMHLWHVQYLHLINGLGCALWA